MIDVQVLDLLNMTEPRFKALKRSCLVTQKKLEAKKERGELEDERIFNQAYNNFTFMLIAEKKRKEKASA